MVTPVFNQSIPSVTVTELADRMAQAKDQIQLVDVREPEEVAIASIDGFINLPLSQYAEWSGQIQSRLDPDIETFVLCHHGIRSAQMCQWLQNQGFSQVRNITGGIEEYAIVVDETMPRY